MVARFAGASLGLFAFAVASLAGLFARNPIEVVLSRSILALVIFCALGLLLGGAAQWVVAERGKQRELEIRKKYADAAASREGGGSTEGASPNPA